MQLHRSRLIRFARDAYVVPSGDGARVLTHGGAVALDGVSIHGWLHRLVPYLDGSATLDELVADLPADKRAMVGRVVAALDDAGLLRTGPAPTGDPVAEHLDTVADGARATADRWRAARVTVAGTGPLADEIVAALRRAGLTNVATGPGAEVTVAVSDGPVVHAVRRGDDLWIGTGDRDAGIGRWPAGPDTAVSATAAAVAANLVGLALFRAHTGQDDRDTVVRLHLPDLHGSVHRLPPEDGRDAPFDVAAARLVDPRTGVLGEVSERDYAQLPLNIAAASVAGVPRPAIGAGHTPALARERAARRGLEAFLAAAGDFDAVGSGDTESAAISAALMDLCAAVTAAGVIRCVRLDPADLDGDDESAAYREMLEILRVPVEVYDVTGPLGVPTLAYLAEGRTLAYVSAPTAGRTTAAGLRAVLLDVQSRRNGQPDYAPPPVPPLDPTAGPAGPLPAPATVEHLAGRLGARLEWLDHDRAVSRVLRHAVGVVLDA